MTRQCYLATYAKYSRMPLDELQRQLKVLYRRRYEEYDISCCSEYRVASRAYIIRTRKGNGLVFHLKNLVPMLVLILTLSMLKENIKYEFQIFTHSLQTCKVCGSEASQRHHINCSRDRI